MKKHKVAILLATLLLCGISYSQEQVHSGILHSTSNGEESNLVKIHCEGLNDEMITSIKSEFEKYRKEIKSADFDALNQKMYIKYSNDLDANIILGILERIYIKSYYMDSNGNPIYYTKTGNEHFKR